MAAMQKGRVEGTPQKAKVDDSIFDDLPAINKDAAGIDIGSKEHFVAVGDDRDETPVRKFGCFTPDLLAMAEWLKKCRIRTVVMESTGVYWIPVFRILVDYGFDVNLIDARYPKHVPGRKTDVWDSRWLRKLHTYGLLRSCFIPPKQIGVLRTYWRHRASIVESCSQQIHMMQKALEQMNVQLHKVLSDITGMTGMMIIRAIVNGERDPVVLARMKHRLVKNSEETIAKALTGDYRAEHLFTLRQALATFDFHHQMLVECDKQIQECMAQFEDKQSKASGPPEDKAPKHQSRRKNQPHFDLRTELIRISGVDLTKINGIDTITAQTVISECGTDLSAFPTDKHFASWLGLCPNNRITGGKVHSRRTRRVQNRVAQALRVAAQSLHHSKSALGAFFRRMRGRLGAPKAITATAHKLARLIYMMLKHGEAYVDKGQEYYEQQYQDRTLNALTRQAEGMGYTLVLQHTGEVVS